MNGHRKETEEEEEKRPSSAHLRTAHTLTSVIKITVTCTLYNVSFRLVKRIQKATDVSRLR